MGGCSSKPKTTEFEGAMDLRVDKPQVEPARKSVDTEKKAVDAGLKSIDREQKSSSEHSLQTLFVENERGDLRDVLLESQKQPIVGFNPEENGRKAEQKFKENCDQSSAKVAGGETLGAQKELSVTEREPLAPVIAENEIAIEEETQKEQVVPVAEALELQKEPVVANKETIEPQEEPVAVAAEAETTKTRKEPVISSEETLEIQKEPVLTEAETLQVQKEPIVAEEGASEPQKEPIIAEEETLELGKEPVIEGDKTLELQKELIVAEKGFQEEAPREVEKESGQSQFQETIYEDKGLKLDAGPGYDGEGNHGGEEESKEGEQLGDGRGTIACQQVDSATDNGSVAQAEQREGEILEKASEPMEEEKAQSEEIDEAKKEQSALIISTSLDHGDTSAESLTTSSNPPSEVEENDTSCTVPHAMTTNESPRDVTLAVDEPHPIATPITTVPDCPVEEDQIQVQEADEVTSMSNELQPEPEISVESRVEPTAAPGENIVAPEAEIPLSAPDIQPEHDSLVRELSTKASTMSPVEGELALEEISVDGKNPSSPAKVDSSITESPNIGVPKDSMDLVQEEQVSSPVICNENELNPDIFSTSDQVTAPQDSGVSEGLVIDHEARSQPPAESREVTATTEISSSPEVRSVQVADSGNEPAKPISSKDISAQEIDAPDIDEVLEKLASEFERQESLSRSIP